MSCRRLSLKKKLASECSSHPLAEKPVLMTFFLPLCSFGSGRHHWPTVWCPDISKFKYPWLFDANFLLQLYSAFEIYWHNEYREEPKRSQDVFLFCSPAPNSLYWWSIFLYLLNSLFIDIEFLETDLTYTCGGEKEKEGLWINDASVHAYLMRQKRNHCCSRSHLEKQHSWGSLILNAALMLCPDVHSCGTRSS